MRGVVFVVCLLAASAWAKNLGSEEQQDEENNVQGGYDSIMDDPCSSKHCGPGRECDLNEDGEPVCICAHHCTPETDKRAKVCSTLNVTFDSECELYRQKCLCHRNQAGCEERVYKRAHMDYYGECQEIPECKEWEMEEFPSRMRQWFYMVMEELADRRDLSENERKMAEETKTLAKKWVLPVIWKFCDLDVSKDRMVDASELLPITAPLKPLEHCTGPFLDGCDADANGQISLEEWGTCLGLDEDDIEDRCDALRD